MYMRRIKRVFLWLEFRSLKMHNLTIQKETPHAYTRMPAYSYIFTFHSFIHSVALQILLANAAALVTTRERYSDSIHDDDGFILQCILPPTLWVQTSDVTLYTRCHWTVEINDVRINLKRIYFSHQNEEKILDYFYYFYFEMRIISFSSMPDVDDLF